MGDPAGNLSINWGNNNPEPPDDDDQRYARRIVLTPASAIKVRRVRWCWEHRIALGTLALLAGREGLGKSTLAYHLAAQVSRGLLEGELSGHPRPVLIAASEDSWEHTIVPRLIAAGADLDKIFRIEVVTHDDMHISVSLPQDFTELDQIAAETKPGLMILDPLMSVIDAKLDTHRDRELRQALEPLTALADRTRMAIIGLIHHNKSGSTDALQLVMGSKAFAAVARSVHTTIIDPDDETQARRLFATSKNNLGRLDLPILGFTITAAPVETEDDGTAWTGRLTWTGEVEGSMHEIMTRAADPERGATAEAADWLHDYLTSEGGTDDSTTIKREGRKVGHSEMTLKRARTRINATLSSSGFPRRTFWTLPHTAPTTPPLAGTNASEPSNRPPDAGPTVSGTNAGGPTDDARKRTQTQGSPVGPTLSDISQSDQPDQPLVPLGPTGVDQAKHDLARARTHAGRVNVGLTDSLGPTAETQSDQWDQSDQRPPARGTHPGVSPSICNDCGWPAGSNGHYTNCERT
jgi:hypothetical protein